MQLSSGSTRDFVSEVAAHELTPRLEALFFDAFRYRPSPNEVRAWTNSLGAMAGAVEGAKLDYTAQGFEYDYGGVIFGRDLVYRPGSGWVGQRSYSHDRVVKRDAKAPEAFAALVENAYRVLLTRGIRGCAVYFEDGPTRAFVLSRLETSRRRDQAPAA